MVENVLKTAFCDWETATGIDFEYLGTIQNSNGIMNDHKNVIYFDVANGNTLANTSVYEDQGICSNPLNYFDGVSFGFDMKIDNQKNWYVSTMNGISTTKYDLYSVIMHEIGHVLLLKHSMDIDPLNETFDDRLMYWQLNNNQIKRTIDTKTLSGIELLKNRTIADLDNPTGCLYNNFGWDLDIYPFGCSTSINEQNEVECQILDGNIFKIGQEILVSPNAGFKIYDSIGKLKYSEKGQNSPFYLQTSDWNSGLYLMQYFCNNKKVVRKVFVF